MLCPPKAGYKFFFGGCMRINYQGQQVETALTAGDSLTLYAVPQEYSEDGLFLAVWGRNELEPIPACAVPTLLLRLSMSDGMNGEAAPVEHFKAEGVTYAAN